MNCSAGKNMKKWSRKICLIPALCPLRHKVKRTATEMLRYSPSHLAKAALLSSVRLDALNVKSNPPYTHRYPRRRIRVAFIKAVELTFGGFQRNVMTFLLPLKYRMTMESPDSVSVCVHAQVHSSCKEQMGKVCPLGQCRVSIIPPTALNSIDSDGEKHRTHTHSFVQSIAWTDQSSGMSPFNSSGVNPSDIEGATLGFYHCSVLNIWTIFGRF